MLFSPFFFFCLTAQIDSNSSAQLAQITNAKDFSPIDLKASYKDKFHCPHFTGGKRGTGRLSDLPKVSQPASGRTKTVTPRSRLLCIPDLVPLISVASRAPPTNQEQLFISDQLQRQFCLNYSPPAVPQPPGQSVVPSPSLVYNWCRKSTVNSFTMLLQLQKQYRG